MSINGYVVCRNGVDIVRISDINLTKLLLAYFSVIIKHGYYIFLYITKVFDNHLYNITYIIITPIWFEHCQVRSKNLQSSNLNSQLMGGLIMRGHVPWFILSLNSCYQKTNSIKSEDKYHEISTTNNLNQSQWRCVIRIKTHFIQNGFLQNLYKMWFVLISF